MELYDRDCSGDESFCGRESTPSRGYGRYDGTRNRGYDAGWY